MERKGLKDIYVKVVDGKWGVEFHGTRNDKNNRFISMQSKEDAVRYARICEQRTGSRVLLLG